MRYLPLLLVLISAPAVPEDVIVFTAHQTWDSRVYVLSMDGQLLDWHQFDMYRLCDMEVVGKEIHIVDAFAPRSFILDIETWDLELVIDDWSLFYFYDIAWDGEYLYVTEWDMNRYLPDGAMDSSTGFEYDVLGSCWDGERLWTLNEDDIIRCWDIDAWPEISELTADSFSPPGDSCRGLWHDGEYFWSAEARDGVAGWIYRFDDTGSIIEQWQAPAFTGWAACAYEGYPSTLSSGTWASIKSMAGGGQLP